MANQELAAHRSKAWRAVVEAYQVCSTRYAATLEKCGLTTAQYEVMLLIRVLDDQATPKRIADRLLVTKGNITGVTSRLLSRELISKYAHDYDGRSMVFRLTDVGHQLLSDVQVVANEFVRQQLEPFNDAEVEIVGRLMRQMKSHLLTMDPETVIRNVSSRN